MADQPHHNSTRRTGGGVALRLSRPCYDKPHRCPGWAGGGVRYATVARCDNGRIRIPYRSEAEAMLAALDGSIGGHPAAHPFRFGRCTVCNVVTLPWATRHLDPTQWLPEARSKLRRMRWRIEDLIHDLRTKNGNP